MRNSGVPELPATLYNETVILEEKRRFYIIQYNILDIFCSVLTYNRSRYTVPLTKIFWEYSSFYWELNSDLHTRQMLQPSKISCNEPGATRVIGVMWKEAAVANNSLLTPHNKMHTATEVVSHETWPCFDIRSNAEGVFLFLFVCFFIALYMMLVMHIEKVVDFLGLNGRVG